MRVSDLKETIRQLTELYFTGATVQFAKRSFAAKPNKPLVILSPGSVQRPLNPPTKMIDGRPVCFYPAIMPIQIDLFTHGKVTEVAPGFTPVAENTAEDDMIGFTSFLNSAYAVQWCSKRDIAVIVPNVVQDLTGLINDTNYEFRAMIELTVSFTMAAIGYTGTLEPESVKRPGGGCGVTIDPIIGHNPSGGGNEDFADEENGYFTNVEINDELVKKEETSNEQQS